MGDLGFWWKLIFAVDTSKRCYGNPFLLLAVSSRIRIINYNFKLTKTIFITRQGFRKKVSLLIGVLVSFLPKKQLKATRFSRNPVE